MEIRDVRAEPEEEVAAYWALRLRAVKEEPEAFGSSYEESLARPLAQVVERLRASEAAGDFTLVATEADGTLSGMVGFVRAPGAKSRHNGMVWGMYVAPEARSRGYGRALMETLIARARALDGLEKLALDVVTTNAPARALYHALGFTIYGVRPQALKLPDGRYLDEEFMILTL